MSMPSTLFKQVDVFTGARFKGNPVAVVFDAEDLTTQQMQRIATWTNMPRTTFVLPTEKADYRVRIFTPNAELPFAGHPTIGTAHALLEAGFVEPKDGMLIQDCAAGLVKLSITEQGDGKQWIDFDLPQPDIVPLQNHQISDLEALLGASVLREVRPAIVKVGPRWVVAQMKSAQDVLSCRPDVKLMQQSTDDANSIGIAIFGAHADATCSRIEVRSFTPANGMNEDPVCGGANGAVAAFIRHTDQLGVFGQEFYATQGSTLGRSGVLRLTINGEVIRVGGVAETRIDGQIAV